MAEKFYLACQLTGLAMVAWSTVLRGKGDSLISNVCREHARRNCWPFYQVFDIYVLNRIHEYSDNKQA